MDGKTIKMK